MIVAELKDDHHDGTCDEGSVIEGGQDVADDATAVASAKQSQSKRQTQETGVWHQCFLGRHVVMNLLVLATPT